MFKKNVDIRRLLIPSDAVAILVIIIGLVIALFIHEIAIRLIGVSVAILGAVAMFMLISQRISETVSIRHTPKEPRDVFQVTKKKDVSATRTVIENFDAAFGPDDSAHEKDKTKEKLKNEYKKDLPNDKPKIKPLRKHEKFHSNSDVEAQAGPNAKSASEPQHYGGDVENFMGSDEGFRIIKKTQRIVAANDTKEKDDKKKAETKDAGAKDDKPIHREESDKSGKAHIPDRRGPGPIMKEVPTKKTSDIDKTPPETAKEVPEKKSKMVFNAPPPEPPAITEPPKETEKDALSYRAKPIDLPLTALMEDFTTSGEEPRKEFEYFLERVLMAIRSVTNTRTAAFILVNSEKRELILESFVTDVRKAIVGHKKIPLGNDVVSQIVLNSKPEILTDINPAAELDLIPYYAHRVKTASFIGVPVFFENSVIGALCADTNVLDAYDSVTVGFLGQFTKLISALVQSYTGKYDLLEASRGFEAVKMFHKKTMTKDATVKDIANALVDSAWEIFDHTSIGFFGFSEEDEVWTALAGRTASGADEKNLVGTPLSLENTLVGASIINNRTYVISPLTGERTRVHPGEKKLKGGYLVSIPIQLKTIGSVFGALYLEGDSPANLTENGISILETLCDLTGSSFEKQRFVNILENSALFDYSTGILNASAFSYRLREEFLRNADFNQTSTLCLFKIDKYAALDPEKFGARVERALYHVVNIAGKLLRPYDIIGKTDGNIFGILLIGMKLQQSQLWGERLRKEIAISSMDIDGKSLIVTVSMGLADAAEADSIDSLLENANLALETSLEKSNCLTIF